MNRLDNVVTKNIKTKKYQINEAIYNDVMFGVNSFDSYIGTRYPLPVVSATLQVGKKHRATTVAGITCFYYIRAIDIMINRKHTKYY